MTALFKKIDCLSIPVQDLDEALRFYRDSLGHALIWRDARAAGLRLPGSDAELVLHLDRRPAETDIQVESVAAAIERFCQAGGTLVGGPFEIRIGQCAILADPFGNRLVILDCSRGALLTDAEGRVSGNAAPEAGARA